MRSKAWGEFKRTTQAWHFTEDQLILLALGELLDSYQGEYAIFVTQRIINDLAESRCHYHECQCRSITSG